MRRNLDIWQEIFKGIENSRRAFSGPYVVQIDLTDKCNSTCIGCWVHSPLVDKKEVFPEGERELPFNLVERLIEELYRLGTQEIILSGSGEPFLYPKIKEVIKFIKSRNIRLNIITNAALIDEEMAALLVKDKVDLITASIWAGNVESYILTHPGKTEIDFKKIKTNLKILKSYKDKYNYLKPHLKLYNVICSKNYNDIKEMVEFAKYVDADSVEFQTVDLIPGKTEAIAIIDTHRKEIIRQLEIVRNRKDLVFFNAPKEAPLDSFIKEEFLDFGKIWKSYKDGFRVAQYSDYLICKEGHNITDKRIIVSESTSVRDTHPAVFWYKFKNKICKGCKEKDNCLDDTMAIDVKLLNILGIGSFLRRLLYSDLEKGVYEKQINTIPCYIGWYYARILTNGRVIPCCKAAKFPLGSLYKAGFSKIWHSSLYEEFRFKAKNLPKSNSYFSKLNCVKSCDNWGMNLEIEKRIKEFTKKDVCKSERQVSAQMIQGKEKKSYFRAIMDHVSREGVKRTIKRIIYNVTPRNLKERYLEILGIYDGEHGYKGPFHVQIDLTNNCNNTCIACWCNSPLFKTPRLSKEEKKQYLPLAMVKEFLDEISHMGATEIYYSGGGEPFMHPQIMEVLEYTKKKKLVCHVNTNFTLLNKERLDRLINIGVDFLTVSTWAATADTYVKTHLNRVKDDFYKIKENLIYVNTHKKDKPQIKLYNVIFNMNYFEVEKMVDFAKSTGSESLEFTLVDTIPNVTDVLALNEQQLVELGRSCAEIKSKLNKRGELRGTNVLIFRFEQFLRRISVFEDAKEAKYDRNIIDSIPCYIGWLFARIVPSGEVHSCLKAHRIPTGSLYTNRFFEIWNSKKQEYFRKKTLTYEKNDPFFKLIGNDSGTKEAGCYKSCDDIGRNTWMHNRLQMLSFPEKVMFKSLAYTLKIARKITSQKKKSHSKYHKDPVIAGIIHGRKVFTGPEQVVIDPTNKCNLRCISCWLYSPLLDKDKPSSDWLKKELPKHALFELIENLASLGTKKIRFTGGGEPFMHKNLMEVIEFARKKQLQVAITTNFGLVSKKQIKRL
ncbi:MAG: radical SAM protein, partial [Candidatus Omnitrophica bacterium]|nr:radical SAM protein [Candidatus Omnitrophota bacterium]